MFAKVLIPYDLRFMPRMALRAAAALAHAGAELNLLHVADIVRDLGHAPFAMITEEEINAYRTREDHKIDDALAYLSEYGAKASVCLVRGNGPVHAVINRVARAIGADAIVMGTRGRRGLLRALFGSVTESVMREADVPVIAIRESSKRSFAPVFSNIPVQ